MILAAVRRGRPAAGAAPCWQGHPGQGSLSSRQRGLTFTQAADLILSVVKILCLALTQPGIDRNSQKRAMLYHYTITYNYLDTHSSST